MQSIHSFQHARVPLYVCVVMIAVHTLTYVLYTHILAFLAFWMGLLRILEVKMEN